MNEILQLKGKFSYKKNAQVGGRNLPANSFVKSEHLYHLRDQLESILKYWKDDRLIGGALISVHCKHVLAKSNRIQGIFVVPSSQKPNDYICGAKFEGAGASIRHIFTYYFDLDVIRASIDRLGMCARIVDEAFGGRIDRNTIEHINKMKYKFNAPISRTTFINVIVDSCYVERFAVDSYTDEAEDQAIITVYKTKLSATEILHLIGVEVVGTKIIDENTLLLNREQIELLKQKVPYLIAMQTKDISKLNPSDIIDVSKNSYTIPTPQNEPVIGVIDTVFSDDVYFKDWVSAVNMLDPEIPLSAQDYMHGTAVTSLIVDGPTLNPSLDDGCGRFRVKHFGVATGGAFSSFSVLKAIRQAVSQNRDIKVWNISLGSAMEVHQNFISPEAAELDKIQSDYGVAFVVAGTNKSRKNDQEMRVGSPADSINSIVVNSVRRDRAPASYHRVGPVLSFFHKPDVSSYGGDIGERINVCTPTGIVSMMGTSFAAPWIARKMAYLIYNMGLTREVAKALLIDAAAGWERSDTEASSAVGYGVVPQKIGDILYSPNDEIRFIITGTADQYETYTYSLPVPISKDKHPYYARATLCYYPRCSRQQGVDYTNTELDIHFGRVKESGDRKGIKSINNNVQGDKGHHLLYEGSARDLYRKWDNIKHISDSIKERAIPRKKIGDGNWGLSILIKERLTSSKERSIPFGVVITLKEMNGINRIDEFVKNCNMRGWIVNRVSVDNMVDIYNKAEEEIKFE